MMREEARNAANGQAIRLTSILLLVAYGAGLNPALRGSVARLGSRPSSEAPQDD
jgi:hypothetical protein